MFLGLYTEKEVRKMQYDRDVEEDRRRECRELWDRIFKLEESVRELKMEFRESKEPSVDEDCPVSVATISKRGY